MLSSLEVECVQMCSDRMRGGSFFRSFDRIRNIFNRPDRTLHRLIPFFAMEDTSDAFPNLSRIDSTLPERATIVIDPAVAAVTTTPTTPPLNTGLVCTGDEENTTISNNKPPSRKQMLREKLSALNSSRKKREVGQEDKCETQTRRTNRQNRVVSVLPVVAEELEHTPYGRHVALTKRRNSAMRVHIGTGAGAGSPLDLSLHASVEFDDELTMEELHQIALPLSEISLS